MVIRAAMTRRRTMLTGVVLFVLMTLFVTLLCGCEQRYTEEDAQAKLEQGTEGVNAWVMANMPDAKVASCANKMFSYPSGPSHLTDYVEGELTLADGSQQSYAYNVVSKEMYLAWPEEALSDATRSYLAELFDIKNEDAFNWVNVALLVPYSVEGSSIKGPTDFLELYLVPAEVTDLDAFVRDADNRYRLTVHTSADVEDDNQLSRWTFDELQDLSKRANLRFYALYLSNTHEVVDCLDDESYYEHWDWYDVGPFRLWAQDTHVSEQLDKNGDVTREETKVNPQQALNVQETEEGYSLTYSDKEFPYVPFVDDDSDLLYADWTWVDDDGEIDVRWVNQGNGLWLLKTVNGTRVFTYQDALLRYR